jgi:hypothetical protein
MAAFGFEMVCLRLASLQSKAYRDFDAAWFMQCLNQCSNSMCVPAAYACLLQWPIPLEPTFW